MTVFGSDGRARDDIHQGDAGYVPRGYGHHIENIGDEPLRILIGFNSRYREISLSTWLAANPEAVLAAKFRVDDSLIAKLSKKRVFIASKGIQKRLDEWTRTCHHYIMARLRAIVSRAAVKVPTISLRLCFETVPRTGRGNHHGNA